MKTADHTGGELANFATRLKSLIGDPCSGRPFVCTGSPLACRVLIVGQNPAKETANFWRYWSDDDGINRVAWRERYLAKNALSPTRKRIEHLADLISAPVLETNIWCVEAGSGKHLTRADRSTAVFEMLLDQIRPAVVVAHGSKAISLLGQMSTRAQVIAVPHLSGLGSPKGFGWNDQRLQQLAARVNGAVSVPGDTPRHIGT
ncbi:hypothetical protein CP157_03781 (plasmid) [Paracoccus marcusii]|uniref:uracil-DNA glycosylase family protein n=1 Tax=Paracoccus marcusii TaxID=59779 RepID=UPI001C3D54F0|nr:uracil-DNA glycosylase family protein [Paracoccus marcusii]QXI65989.1 hypothetical protein CP157_03781 [Paracoccus marcusii]